MDPKQQSINELDAVLSATIRHPEIFVDVRRVRTNLEERIMQLECEQLAQIEDSRPDRRLNSKVKQNVIVPIIPAWQHGGKGVGN